MRVKNSVQYIIISSSRLAVLVLHQDSDDVMCKQIYADVYVGNPHYVTLYNQR